MTGRRAARLQLAGREELERVLDFDDIDVLARELARFFSDPVEIALNAIMASGSSPDFDALVLDHFGPVFDAWRDMVERARNRGELRPNVDADTVLYTLTAPLLTIPLLFHRTPTPGQVRRIAETVYAGTTSIGH
jgi:hypothetical protein